MIGPCHFVMIRRLECSLTGLFELIIFASTGLVLVKRRHCTHTRIHLKFIHISKFMTFVLILKSTLFHTVLFAPLPRNLQGCTAINGLKKHNRFVPHLWPCGYSPCRSIPRSSLSKTSSQNTKPSPSICTKLLVLLIHVLHQKKKTRTFLHNGRITIQPYILHRSPKKNTLNPTPHFPSITKISRLVPSCCKYTHQQTYLTTFKLSLSEPRIFQPRPAELTLHDMTLPHGPSSLRTNTTINASTKWASRFGHVPRRLARLSRFYSPSSTLNPLPTLKLSPSYSCNNYFNGQKWRVITGWKSTCAWALYSSDEIRHLCFSFPVKTFQWQSQAFLIPHWQLVILHSHLIISIRSKSFAHSFFRPYFPSYLAKVTTRYFPRVTVQVFH